MRYVHMAWLHLHNDDRTFQSSHGTPNTIAKNITAGHTLLCMQKERGVGHEEQKGVGREGAERSGP